MQNEKNDIHTISAADEELLRSFFAPSSRMTIADNGFSHRVMKRISTEMPLSQRLVCGVWSVVCLIMSVALFVFKDGMSLLKNSFMDFATGTWHTFAQWTSTVNLSRHLPELSHISYTTPLLAAVVLIVLGSLAIYNVVETEE